MQTKKIAFSLLALTLAIPVAAVAATKGGCEDTLLKIHNTSSHTVKVELAPSEGTDGACTASFELAPGSAAKECELSVDDSGAHNAIGTVLIQSMPADGLGLGEAEYKFTNPLIDSPGCNNRSSIKKDSDARIKIAGVQWKTEQGKDAYTITISNK